MRVLAAPLRALLGCFDFVFGKSRGNSGLSPIFPIFHSIFPFIAFAVAVSLAGDIAHAQPTIAKVPGPWTYELCGRIASQPYYNSLKCTIVYEGNWVSAPYGGACINKVPLSEPVLIPKAKSWADAIYRACASSETHTPWATQASPIFDGSCSNEPRLSEGIEVSSGFFITTSGTGKDFYTQQCSVNFSMVSLAQRYRAIDCSQTYGYTDTGANTCGLTSKQVALANTGNGCYMTPQPVNIATGNKFLQETDYRGSGVFPLEFVRHYNKFTSNNLLLGAKWRHNYERWITLGRSGGYTTASGFRPDGKTFYFNLVSGIWTPDKDLHDRLLWTTDAGGKPTSWTYVTADDTKEIYDADGRLKSIVNRSGYTITLNYDLQSKLLSVTDSAQRSLTFTYYAGGHLKTVKDPEENLYQYEYNGASSNSTTVNNLTAVTYPGGKKRVYYYQEPSGNQPGALTSVADENGATYASYHYTTSGQVDHEELAGGISSYNLVYNADGSTVVTDPLGTQRTYNFVAPFTQIKHSGSNQPGGSGCAAASVSQTYDPNGNVATRTDFNGNTILYGYDLTRNLETSRTEAVGKPEARTITTTWHPSFRLPATITEPGRLTTNVYDDTSGNLLSRSIKDTVSGKTRTWTYTYTTASDGTLPNLLKSVDGPRTDVSDITTYRYYPNGDLQSVRNALGHETRITQYDPHGRPQIILDPNSIVTELSYWPRGWLKSRSVAGETSYYDYDGVGQITKVTAPDGSYISYTYDDAHRLTDIYDAIGNRIHYTLDNIGNRTKEDVYNNLGALVTTKSRIFDALNRLWKDIGALNQTTTYAYDANGNLKKIDGPLTDQNDVTVHSYDALNRLASSTDALSGITRYGYDALDQLRSVTDPRSLTTSYSVNALGEQTQLASPDTGTANSNYDAAGNLVSRSDADGKLLGYSYDALNRVTTITHEGTPVYTFSYDQGLYALGKLTGMTGGSGPTSYTYNAQGRLQSKVQQAGFAGSLTTTYSYNLSGQLASTTYPSGKLVTYSYNSLGQIAGISVNGQPVISNASYQPFGPVASWNWGNNSPYTRNFDSDGRLSTYPLGPLNTRALGFDNASRIQNQTETAPFANTLFTYDELDRLKTWQPPNTNQSYDYDADGNRIRLVLGGNSYTNTISPTSNRLQSVAGPNAKTYSYNNSGNRIGDDTNTFNYDSAQRLSSVAFPGGNSFYYINALGQRVLKYGTGVTLTHFIYDEGGKLIGEYDSTGQPLEETIYLGDLPVAVLR